MDKRIVTMNVDKTTKNTTRYEEELAHGEESLVPTIYLRTATLGQAPRRIQVTIEDAPED